MPNGVSGGLRPPEPQNGRQQQEHGETHQVFFRNISVESVSAAPGSEVAAHGAGSVVNPHEIPILNMPGISG